MSLDISQLVPDSAGEPSPQADHARGVRPPVPARGKAQRRPLLFALMAALVAAGALLAAWAYTAASDTREVLVVSQDVPRGEVIKADDLQVVRVGVDPALTPVSGAEKASLVGRRAQVDLWSGTLLTEGAISEQLVPAAGQSLVGISLTPAQMPAEQLSSGDAVRIVETPGDQGQVTTQVPVTIQARVVGVSRVAETGERVVNVSVPHEKAADLAARAATGKVALVLDSRER